MNNGDRWDLLSDSSRVVLDQQLLARGGHVLWTLEHKLRLFNELLELMQTGHIPPGSVELVEVAQELKDAVHAFDL